MTNLILPEFTSIEYRASDTIDKIIQSLKNSFGITFFLSSRIYWNLKMLDDNPHNQSILMPLMEYFKERR